jgi:osmoprotectant transport system ATP-binding protein
MFALDDVSKAYQGRPAIERLTLEVEPGRTTVLIGPSGCGKSTLLRLLLGLVWPDSGTVRYDGEPLAPERIATVRRRVGYVIQQGGLFPHLTARQNMTLMAEHLGWPAGRIASRVRELTALTHFPEDGLQRYPGELSGGQNQRVGLMRALMLDPEALLLDEPLGALDPMVRFELQKELRQIFSSLRKTVVLVTHDLAEAAYLADSLVLMRDGRIVQRGSVAALLETPADEFVTRFVQAQRSHLDGQGAAR